MAWYKASISSGGGSSWIPDGKLLEMRGDPPSLIDNSSYTDWTGGGAEQKGVYYYFMLDAKKTPFTKVLAHAVSTLYSGDRLFFKLFGFKDGVKTQLKSEVITTNYDKTINFPTGYNDYDFLIVELGNESQNYATIQMAVKFA